MSRKQIPKSEREIAQQRIEGKLPAAIDPDTGKEINPRIYTTKKRYSCIHSQTALVFGRRR